MIRMARRGPRRFLSMLILGMLAFLGVQMAMLTTPCFLAMAEQPPALVLEADDMEAPEGVKHVSVEEELDLPRVGETNNYRAGIEWPGSSPDAFAYRWDYATANDLLHVLSIVQDHRRWAPNLPKLLLRHPFAQMHAEEGVRVFQFHMAAHRSAVGRSSSSAKKMFGKVRLCWSTPVETRDSPPAIIKAENCTNVLEPTVCHAELPLGTAYRMMVGWIYTDMVARCSFPDDPLLLPSLLDPRYQARLLISGPENQQISFPLAHVIHFPDPIPLVYIKPRPRDGYPSAPWYDPADPHLTSLIKRAAPGSEADKIRVVGATTKKFGWFQEDEMWLLWMLDVVGVDHIILPIGTRDMSVEVVEEALAKHPGLTERVTILDKDMPGKPDYLTQATVYDLIVRFQVDFEFSLIFDMDEYLQLFDPKHARMRMDIKTFIFSNREKIEHQGQALFERPMVSRNKKNDEEEPLVAPFLTLLLGLDAEQTLSFPSLQGDIGDWGKVLWWRDASVRPYLHWNQDWRKEKWDRREAHLFHIRYRKGKRLEQDIEWYLEHFGNKNRRRRLPLT